MLISSNIKVLFKNKAKQTFVQECDVFVLLCNLKRFCNTVYTGHVSGLHRFTYTHSFRLRHVSGLFQLFHVDFSWFYLRCTYLSSLQTPWSTTSGEGSVFSCYRMFAEMFLAAERKRCWFKSSRNV